MGQWSTKFREVPGQLNIHSISLFVSPAGFYVTMDKCQTVLRWSIFMEKTLLFNFSQRHWAACYSPHPLLIILEGSLGVACRIKVPKKTSQQKYISNIYENKWTVYYFPETPIEWKSVSIIGLRTDGSTGVSARDAIASKKREGLEERKLHVSGEEGWSLWNSQTLRSNKRIAPAYQAILNFSFLSVWPMQSYSFVLKAVFPWSIESSNKLPQVVIKNVNKLYSAFAYIGLDAQMIMAGFAHLCRIGNFKEEPRFFLQGTRWGRGWSCWKLNVCFFHQAPPCKILTKGSHQLKKNGILWIKFIKRWPPRGVPLLWIPIFIFFCSIIDVKKTKFLGWKEDSQSPPWTLKAPLELWKGN